MSSISQIERSSSQIRRLGKLGPFPDCRRQYRRGGPGGGSRVSFWLDRGSGVHVFVLGCAFQLQYKGAALSQFRSCKYFTFVRLHNLIYDGQPQSRTSFEA